MAKRRLGVGFIGSGFNTRFHMQAWQGVRDADVLGVWSPNHVNATSAAALARKLDVGRARAFKSIAAMVADPAIDAIWLCGPNHARLANVEEIADTVLRGRGELVGLACEKPLARTVKEAKQVAALTRKVRPQARLPREPALQPAGGARPYADLGARRGHHGPALPGPRGRGA